MVICKKKNVSLRAGLEQRFFFRAVRYFGSEQILLMLTFSHGRAVLLNGVSLLFNVLNEDIVTENGSNAFEYFHVGFK